jgi:hypothetical protein
MSKKIGRFELKNEGVFIARMDADYRVNGSTWTRVHLTGDILTLQNDSADPGEHNVPDGADVRLVGHIVAGTDKIASRTFTYMRGNNHSARYAISGLITDPTLALIERT